MKELLRNESGIATLETAVVFILATLCVAGGTAWVFRSTGILRGAMATSGARGDDISQDPCEFCGRLDTCLRITDTLLDGVDWITGRIGGR